MSNMLLLATAELILSDFLDIAFNGVQKHGAGSLVINLINDTTTFMRPQYIEEDIHVAERYEDEDVLDFLKDLCNASMRMTGRKQFC